MTTRYSLWKHLGKLLMVLELCVQGIMTNTSPPPPRCPSVCICTSDLLSCTRQNLQQVPLTLPPTAITLDLSHNVLFQLHDHWLASLPRLQALRISHNQIKELFPKTFHNATYLRHLDISSNYLHAVERYYFDVLVNLEELLIYDNWIIQVDEKAFARLSSLQKLYLSWNNLTKFPFQSMQGFSHPKLRTLDLSSNNLSSIPIDEIMALPVSIKNGLYLHNNPVKCNCALYQMFQQWKQRGFSSVQDFLEEHTCRAFDSVARSLVRFLKYTIIFENCSLRKGYLGAPEVNLRVLVEKPLLMDCNTSVHDPSATYMWISPHHEPITHPGNSNRTLEVYHNGSLKITAAKPWHSGVYICIAISKHYNLNKTHEVNVTVHYPKLDGESFNTGLTTLLGCVVSLVLVFMYLYLTPCCCFRCCKRSATLSPPQECSAQSSILSTTPPATEGPSRKISTHKHVVFLEPIKEVQNGKIQLAVSEDFPDTKNPKILQLKSDSESIGSIFSDTPIMS
ncbi:PREDICTED: amphoterin-induced protein 3 [Gavialis gangeticus]|uniref:amphoterin-induced protein 3 n=1 Tax=Gavialis gangeticus TaxID=94835 RepID=UPI00092E671A|nr:PREDICTED: amphoterin-induced protein 3 [Gavialis gangeticus]